MTEIPKSEEDLKGSTVKTEGQAPRLEELSPGDVIKLSNITELTAFEDMIVDIVQPDHNPDKWATREKLRDLIRPPRFNGTIADIELTVMADPYERLLDAPERGWQGGHGRGSVLGRKHKLTSQLAES